MAKRNRSTDKRREPSTVTQIRVRQPTIDQRPQIDTGRPTSQIHSDINKLLVSERARKAASKSPLIISKLNQPQQLARAQPLQQITTEPDRVRDNGLRLPTKNSPVKQSPEKVREKNVCKSRPKKNKGNGGSRSFIPWCKR